MATAVRRQAEELVLEDLRTNTPEYAEALLKILPAERAKNYVPLVPNKAQLALDRKLEEQRVAGKPQRAIVLKARKVGVSTWVQAKLIQRSTLTANHHAVVVAHDVDAGGTLYSIGYQMWKRLPDEADILGIPLRPEVRSYRGRRHLHFGQTGHIGMVGEIWPDSTYWVDTAGEPESGRGSTPHGLHLSEVAFWPQAEQKYVALMQAIPEKPDTLVVVESTANGNNYFKELWDKAWEPDSGFVPVFWPWWKMDEYTKPFETDRARDEFRVGDTTQSAYAEEEPELIDPGPIDIDTGEHVPLTLEQLNWRRSIIANKCGGRIEKFHQEYPATPEQAFLATGRKVFEPMLVARARAQAEKTDPRFGEGGPISGAIVATERKMQAGQHGRIEVPKGPAFKPARLLPVGEAPDWRVWLDYEDGKLLIPEEARYVVGVDVSEGLPESDDDSGDPAWHAIEIIDHKTREQVAEYRSRCDPDLLAEYAVMAAELFNEAWLAIEKTGPGLHVVRKVWLDLHYKRTYFRVRHEARSEDNTDRLGWDTNRATKHLLISGAQELLREGTHGIRSRRLVGELETYVRLSTGKMVPERGKFSDLLMAWAIAQQVAAERPIPKPRADRDKNRPAMRPGYSAYAGRR